MTKKTAKIFDDGCGCIGTPTKFIKTGGLCGNCITRLYSDWEELEEIHGKTIDIVIDLYHRLEKVEQSRDELLEALKDALECAYFSTGDATQYLNIIQKAEAINFKKVDKVIQKAQALKDKV